MVCGILLTVIGFCTFFFCFVYAILHPWNYNGTDGLLGSLLGTPVQDRTHKFHRIWQQLRKAFLP